MLKTRSINTFVFILGVLFGQASFADTVWIDVRSAAEHHVDNIEGDIRITHSDIVKEIAQLYPDKNTEIQLYCRSGGRAGVALSALKEAGYTNVSNAGGINDARKARDMTN